MTEPLVFYTSKASPFGHRVELALAEAGVPHEKFYIDTTNKPAWFTPEVNPTGKVPAIAYGGPRLPADQPSPESAKIAESLVLLEFVADIAPNSSLLPKDPVQRAKVRFFINAAETGFFTAYIPILLHGERDITTILATIKTIQDLLSEHNFAVGNAPTIADFALLPMVAHAEVCAKENLLPALVELFKELREPKFAKFWTWYTSLKARPSFINTFDEASLAAYLCKRFEALATK